MCEHHIYCMSPRSDAPKNVTLLMPEKVIAGSSVTITCSSEANPAVTPEGYNLYKDGQLIVSGQNVTIADVRPNDTGLYHCTAWNNIMGEDVTNSTEVYLDVQCKYNAIHKSS